MLPLFLLSEQIPQPLCEQAISRDNGSTFRATVESLLLTMKNCTAKRKTNANYTDQVAELMPSCLSSSQKTAEYLYAVAAVHFRTLQLLNQLVFSMMKYKPSIKIQLNSSELLFTDQKVYRHGLCRILTPLDNEQMFAHASSK